MAETWLEELPTCLPFGDHRAEKKTHKRLAGSPREEKDPAAPTGPHAPIFCSPLSRNAGPVWLTPGPLPSQNLPLKLITDKYQLVSSLQEVLGSGGEAQGFIFTELGGGEALEEALPSTTSYRRWLRGGFHHRRRDSPEGGKAGSQLRASCRPWQWAWLGTPMDTGSRDNLTAADSFLISCGWTVQGPKRVTCPMWSLLICWASRGDTEPPAHICQAAGVGGAALSARSAGVSTTRQLGNPRLPFCRATVSSGCCQDSLLPKAQEGTGGYLLGGRSHSAKDRLCSQRQEKLGERIPQQPSGTRLFFWAGGTTSKGQTPGKGHTSTPRWHPLSLGAAPRPHSLERSKASAQNHLHLLGVGPGGAQVDPGGGVHPGWTGIETPRTRNKKHD